MNEATFYVLTHHIRQVKCLRDFWHMVYVTSGLDGSSTLDDAVKQLIADVRAFTPKGRENDRDLIDEKYKVISEILEIHAWTIQEHLSAALTPIKPTPITVLLEAKLHEDEKMFFVHKVNWFDCFFDRIQAKAFGGQGHFGVHEGTHDVSVYRDRKKRFSGRVIYRNNPEFEGHLWALEDGSKPREDLHPSDFELGDVVGITTINYPSVYHAIKGMIRDLTWRKTPFHSMVKWQKGEVDSVMDLPRGLTFVYQKGDQETDSASQ